MEQQLEFDFGGLDVLFREVGKMAEATGLEVDMDGIKEMHKYAHEQVTDGTDRK